MSILPEPNARIVQDADFAETWGIHDVYDVPGIEGTPDGLGVWYDSSFDGSPYGRAYIVSRDFLGLDEHGQPRTDTRFIISGSQFAYNRMYRLWLDQTMIAMIALMDSESDSIILGDEAEALIGLIEAAEPGGHELWLDHLQIIYAPENLSDEIWRETEDGPVLSANYISGKLYDGLVSFDWPAYETDAEYETVIHLVYENGFEFHTTGLVDVPYRVDTFSPCTSGDVELEEIRFFCRIPGSRWSSVSMDYGDRISSHLRDVQLSEVPAS